MIAATAEGFRTNHPDFAGRLLSLEGSIGNGLSNTSDVVRLLAPDAAIVDAMSYGENTAAFAPPCPDVPAGRSLARVPAWNDTDTAADWAPQAIPNPGGPGAGSVLTPTPTPTDLTGATATPTPTATITPTPHSHRRPAAVRPAQRDPAAAGRRRLGRKRAGGRV